MLYDSGQLAIFGPCMNMGRWHCFSCQKKKEPSVMQCKAENYQGICKKCYREGSRMYDFTNHHQQQHHQPIFEKSSQFQPISVPQRYAIIIFHLLQKYNNDEISQIVNCNVKTVRRWIHHFEAEKCDDETVSVCIDEAVSDFPREGTPPHTHEMM